MYFHTERLLLRPIGLSDLEHVYRGLSNPEVIKHYGVNYDSLETTKAQMNWFAELETKQTGKWWAICSQDDTEFYGACGLNNISQKNKKGEIGFWLLPEYWGKGIMKEAMPKIVDYGFRFYGLRRIEGFVESENANCKKALDKVGFEYEGTMRDCEMKNKRFISLDIYSKLKY